MVILSCLAVLAVCLVPSLAQSTKPPSGSAAAGPAQSGIAPALPINRPAPGANNPASANAPPAVSRIITAPAVSPWSVPPVQQQPPPWRSSQRGWGRQTQTNPWAQQAQTNPFQSMPWLAAQSRAVFLDRMDVPCGVSLQRLRMFPGAVDHPDPICECRTIDTCDGMPDFSAQSTCAPYGPTAVCCCATMPYNNFMATSFLGAAGMRNNQMGSPGFNPYATYNTRMQYQGPVNPPPNQGRGPQGIASRSNRNNAAVPGLTDFGPLWFKKK